MIPRRQSTVATLGGQERRGAPRFEDAPEPPIGVALIGLPQCRQTETRQCLQTRWMVGRGGMVAGRPDLGHDLAAIRDEDAFTAADVADVFAQSILEFTQANRLHVANVAS